MSRSSVVNIVRVDVDVLEPDPARVRACLAGWGLSLRLLDSEGPGGGCSLWRVTGGRDAIVAALTSCLLWGDEEAREYVREFSEPV